MNGNTTVKPTNSVLDLLEQHGRLWAVLEFLNTIETQYLTEPLIVENVKSDLRRWGFKRRDGTPFGAAEALYMLAEYRVRYRNNHAPDPFILSYLPENRAAYIQRQHELFSFLPEPAFSIPDHQRVRLGAVQFTVAHDLGQYGDCRVVYSVEEERAGYWYYLTSIGQAVSKNLHDAFVIEYNTHPEDWNKVYPSESNVVLFYPKNRIYIKE